MSTEPKIAIFIEDPGAANGLMNLPTIFQQNNHKVQIFAAGHACAYLEQNNIKFFHADNISENDILTPNDKALITGTSENKESLGFSLIQRARNLSIPSFTFVDSIMNSEHRFRGETDNPLTYKPDFTFVTTEETKTAFTALGLESHNIYVIGHPHYENVQSKIMLEAAFLL